MLWPNWNDDNMAHRKRISFDVSGNVVALVCRRAYLRKNRVECENQTLKYQFIIAIIKCTFYCGKSAGLCCEWSLCGRRDCHAMSFMVLCLVRIGILVSSNVN